MREIDSITQRGRFVPTPTEGLILEVLASRLRSGVRSWPFETNRTITKALNNLGYHGIVWHKPDTIEHWTRVGFTDHGKWEVVEQARAKSMHTLLDEDMFSESIPRQSFCRFCSARVIMAKELDGEELRIVNVAKVPCYVLTKDEFGDVRYQVRMERRQHLCKYERVLGELISKAGANGKVRHMPIGSFPDQWIAHQTKPYLVDCPKCGADTQHDCVSMAKGPGFKTKKLVKAHRERSVAWLHTQKLDLTYSARNGGWVIHPLRLTTKAKKLIEQQEKEADSAEK